MYVVVKLEGFPKKMKCLSGSDNYNEIIQKFEYWTNIKKVPVTICKI